MLAKTIMVQGTASNVGKSIVTTALCRILKRRGYRVAPFKAQNMANNSYVTREGGEIGRAQAVQAIASGIEPSQRMNPILLKPSSDRTSQVVVMGKPASTLSAKDYQHKKTDLLPVIEQALDQLRREFDIVVIEGAGSPAEINMKANDIVNMRIAKMVQAPVILVADIDKGGVFAQIIGTFELLDSEEKKLVKTFLINKFRGDKDILTSGVEWIEEKMKRKCLGVIPMIKDLGIEEEDAVVLDEPREKFYRSSSTRLLINVIRFPRISNFTDFETLAREEDVLLRYIDKPDRHCLPDVLILPGTKSTIADLQFLRSSGFDECIRRCVKAGVTVLGICGGYQMLGDTIEDPYHIESFESAVIGLGFLRMKTVFKKEKTTAQVKALHLDSQCMIEGYEIHMGQSIHMNGNTPLFRILKRQGQAVDDDEGSNQTLDTSAQISGTYIHGLFDNDDFRRYFLNQIRKKVGLESLSTKNNRNALDVYDALADVFEKNMDMTVLSEILGEQLV